jgi:cell division protein FtsQ
MIYKELLQLPLLQVKKIQVEGCVQQTPAEILDIAGIHPQVNLLSLNLKDICRQLESSPWIDKAQVKRTFPDQLYISISEKKPEALINLKQLHLVDGRGDIFKKVENQEGQGLPILTGISWENMMRQKKKHTMLISEALSLMSLLEQKGMPLSKISEINIDPVLGLTVFTTNNTLQIRMGFAPFEKKCNRLYAIMEDLTSKNLIAQTIDLNYRHKAFVKAQPQSGTKQATLKGGERKWGKMEI